MSDLRAGATERIAAARRAAVDELKLDQKPFKNSEDALECAPVFAKFLRALFHSEADELRESFDWEAARLAGIAGPRRALELNWRRSWGEP